MVTVNVSGAVYKPGHVQNESPAEHGSNEPGILQCFTPEHDRDQCWQDKAGNWHQNQVVSTEKKQNDL